MSQKFFTLYPYKTQPTSDHSGEVSLAIFDGSRCVAWLETDDELPFKERRAIRDRIEEILRAGMAEPDMDRDDNN